MIHPTTHLHCLSTSIQVLRELQEIPMAEWDEFCFARATAHLAVIRESSLGLNEWLLVQSFVQKVTGDA